MDNNTIIFINTRGLMVQRVDSKWSRGLRPPDPLTLNTGLRWF